MKLRTGVKRIGQLAPGDTVRFVPVSIDAAEAKLAFSSRLIVLCPKAAVIDPATKNVIISMLNNMRLLKMFLGNCIIFTPF